MNTIIDFEAYISELRYDTIARQNEEKEYINEYEVVRALNVANFCAYKNVADIFLGCAAINLVNTFVKQDGANLNYEFRRHLRRILLSIWELKDKRIQVCIEQKGTNNILIIEICGFQFSFKGEKESGIVRKIEKGRCFKWYGIRKQQCASTIFLSAQCNDFISNSTTAGNNLLDLLDREETNYDNAFAGCTELTTVMIPAGVENISSNAFGNCPKLTTYTEYSNPPSGWLGGII